MDIELTISTLTLGENSDDDNKRFVAAVRSELKDTYPNADVDVDLADNVTADSYWVSDDPTDEIKDDVRLIVGQIFDRGDW